MPNSYLNASLLLAILMASLLVVRRIPAAVGVKLKDWAEGPWFPLAAGILAASLMLWQWGGLRAQPVVYDEAAYLLQAELLASGHWSRPSPPDAEAFTQPAVLVIPVLSPKMPPGHALLLALGVLVHLPGLIPVLLVGGAAALLALLARRLAGPGVAAVAIGVWLTQAGQGRWRVSYFSENTTTVLWLLGWWSLLRWRESRSGGWLLLLAAVTGWGAVTRPLTMIAFALPAGIVVIYETIQSRRWRPLGAAIALGSCCLLLVPLQNSMVLGRWDRSPLTLYTRQYLPFDKMGFGYDSTPPLLRMPKMLEEANAGFIDRHKEHVPGALTKILQDRLRVWWASNFSGWRRLFIPFAFLGLFFLPRAAWIGVASAALLYVLYLAYAHEPYWSLYYAEGTTVIAGVISIGVAWFLRRISGNPEFVVAGSFAIAAVVLCWAEPDLSRWRVAVREAQRPLLQLREELAPVAAMRPLVFIRHQPGHDVHQSLVRNVADPAAAQIITAFDLGPESRGVVKAGYPTRPAFVWDERSHTLTPDAP